MPLYTFVCTNGAPPHCPEVEDLCSLAEAKTPAYAARKKCINCGCPLAWQGVELPQAPDMEGTRGGNFKMKGIRDNGTKVSFEAGRSSRKTKRGK